MRSMIFKITILSLSFITLAACNGGKTNADVPTPPQSSGPCPSALLTDLNLYEEDFNLFNKYGLIHGKELVVAHKTLEALLVSNNVSSCDAIDSSIGEIETISQTSVDKRLKIVFNTLWTAYAGTCRDKSNMSVEEKTGCAHIQYYMKTRFGY